jgi:hypothetical protein
MLAANIAQRVKEIIKNKGKDGWIRVQECANEYAKDVENNPWVKEIVESRKTKFYRFRKKIEKDKVDGLKVLHLPGNVSYVGLSSADPKVIEEFISEDKKASLNVKTGMGFYDYRRWSRERDDMQRDLKERRFKYKMELWRERVYLAQFYDEDSPEYSKKLEKIDQGLKKKYGLAF